MQYLFIPKENGTHVRLSDDVRGDLRTHLDSVVIRSPHPVLESDAGFVLYGSSKLRTITKRELVDYFIALDKVSELDEFISSLPLAEKLRWDASPVVSPRHPYIAANKSMILSALGITSEQYDQVFI